MTVYYCENCNIQTTEKRCPRCGKRHLREVRDDDFCFFHEMEATSAENLKNKLEAEGIGCALIPTGSGLRTKFGMHLENHLVFIQYKGLSYVKDLFAQEAKRKMEAIQQESLAKIDNLFVFDTDAKKIIKQLKLPKDTDLVELAKSIIQSATSGADAGPIGFDEDDLAYNNGKALEDCHYYHLANDQYEVWFNSASMRIYKIKKVK